MKKIILALTLVVMAQSTFAFDATSKIVGSLAVEVVFSTAITSVTSEISSFSMSDAKRKEAQKILVEDEVPGIPLFTSVHHYLVSDRIENYPANVLNNLPYNKVRLKK